MEEILNAEEIKNLIVEELGDEINIEKVEYEVWAIGYDEDECVTDALMLLKSFKNQAEAIAYAKNVELADIVHFASEAGDEPSDVAITYISVEVETVVDLGEDEGTVNVCTIYQKEIQLN